MSALEGLRSAVDLPGLVQRLDTFGKGQDADLDAVLRWWERAQAIVGREVAAGRATITDAAALRQESLDVMAQVPGLQFVTCEESGGACRAV